MLKKGMPPSHPGKILKELYIDPLDLSQGETADNLGVTRKTLSMLLNEHQGISAEMALRLAKAFNTTPELWMNMQNNYDLWKIKQKLALDDIKIFRHVNTKQKSSSQKKTESSLSTVRYSPIIAIVMSDQYQTFYFQNLSLYQHIITLNIST